MAGRARLPFVRHLALVVSSLLLAPSVSAIEFADGRIQVHGFGEMQIRTISKGYKEEWDLTQWYNILNLELEFDIAPDGFGPVDLLEAYVRAEGRFDCTIYRACWLFPSANTYGDRARRLPERLADATDQDYAGVLGPLSPATLRVASRAYPSQAAGGGLTITTDDELVRDLQPSGIVRYFSGPDPAAENPQRSNINQVAERIGFPGLDTLFMSPGADFIIGPDPRTGIDDDPARYAFHSALDFRWGFIGTAGGQIAATQFIGPWLPKNQIVANGLFHDRANPFRGRVTPAAVQGIRAQELEDLASLRAILPFDNSGVFSAATPISVDPLDPRIKNLVVNRDGTPNLGRALTTELESAKVPFAYLRGVPGEQPQPNNGKTTSAFGGDFSGVIPCQEPSKNPQLQANGNFPSGSQYSNNAQLQRRGVNATLGCIPDGRPDPKSPKNPNFVFIPGVSPPGNRGNANLLGLGSNIAIIGGTGEQPMRPAPDKGNLAHFDHLVAQGLYYPSAGLKQQLLSGELEHDMGFNYTELERAWNRGQSQQQTGELKEAYLDIEWLDSRLWTRIGLQNIVWGKTELFRTTDQFNPQDFALCSLCSLEESRIAMWAMRAVYSFYDVGPFDDVRAEIAVNLDEYQPADLGACGEPYTLDVVCSLTTGIFAHSALAVGVAGIDRPPAAWDDIEGAEIGGRVEWRWDRFSFAMTDFWGYDDFPYIDRVWNYDRNVDVVTGRPLVAGPLMDWSAGGCTGFADPSPLRRWTQAPGQRPTSYASMTIAGIGKDPNCLKPGGAAGFPNANGLVDGGNFGDDPGGASPQNALEFHSANLTAFATICAGTVGIAAALDRSACAFNIFGSFRDLRPPIVPVTFAEIVSTNLAGEPDSGAIAFLKTIMNQQTGAATQTVPTVALNREAAFTCATAPAAQMRTCNPNPNSSTPFFGDLKWFGDGRITSTESEINHNIVGGIYPGDVVPQNPTNFLTPDSTMTAEQRALLGCGPFWGTRCDTSDLARNILGGQVFPRGPGGYDPLNTEASAFLQSFVGFDGSESARNGYRGGPFTTTSSTLIQPGTINFRGGPVCTRYYRGELRVLPGCRGADAFTVTATEVQVQFEKGYDPGVDGCMFAPSVGGRAVVAVTRDQTGQNVTDTTLTARLGLCNSSSSKVGNQLSGSIVVPTARTLYHPTAGCFTRREKELGIDDLSTFEGIGGLPCDFISRDFDTEFLAGTAQVFRNEMAAFSYNFMIFLVITSCADNQRTNRNIDRVDVDPKNPNRSRRVLLRQDPECFNAQNELQPRSEAAIDPNTGDFIRPTNQDGNPVIFSAWRSDVCSYNAPHLCTNVKGFMNTAGQGRNDLRAGGNGTYGRRDFIWHSGGEIVLRYDKRNVFGFSMDFAEDVSKTNWGVEFTWINHVPFTDNDSFSNITNSDVFNMTISVDRPTFVNFLNANRTFFMNTQWFFQYVSNYGRGFTSNGPWNVLFTFAMFTGYFQDRLLPTFVSVFDFRSQSGGVLPNIVYRFNESFSLTVGMLWFFGRWELVDMPINEIGPNAPRAGPNAQQDGTRNLLSLFSRRDEVFFVLRYTF